MPPRAPTLMSPRGIDACDVATADVAAMVGAVEAGDEGAGSTKMMLRGTPTSMPARSDVRDEVTPSVAAIVSAFAVLDDGEGAAQGDAPR